MRPRGAGSGYAADVGPINGVTIVLEAHPLPLTLKWSKHLGPAGQQELERLMQEADQSEHNGRRHVLHFGLEAVHQVQLYPHGPP